MDYMASEQQPSSRKDREYQASTSWIITPKPDRRAKLRLFCFHYAGGGASIYRTWPTDLPSTIEVCAVQLPGRERRLNEPAFTTLAPMLDQLVEVILPSLDMPYAFFGHSLGALVAFELTRMLSVRYSLLPVHLLVSGRGAPQMPDMVPPIHHLPDDGFIDGLRRLDGTPEEVLQIPELMELLLPTLRADFAVSETYIYTPDKPLDCPISAFGGQDDQFAAYPELAGWKQQTNRAFNLHMFPGNHFFLHSSRVEVIRTVARDLDPYIRI